MFEDLFPDPLHNKTILDLLFVLADWHALAKLRLHSDSTIGHLRSATTILGNRLRHFVKHICPSFDTRELPKEEAARIRRKQKKSGNKNTDQPTSVTNPRPAQTIKTKILNLFTYKLHALGDYVPTILSFGTTDSYSTQTVSSWVLFSLIEASSNTAVKPNTGRAGTSQSEKVLCPNEQE